MKKKRIHSGRTSRRGFLGAVATGSTVFGAGLWQPGSARADDDPREHREGAGPNPIPGGVVPLKPFGIFVHHNPLNPAVPLAQISDPSQITDFRGFAGLTHIRGAGTGTNTITGATQPLAYQADMGFSQGEFIDADGRHHRGTFAFV
jgi:hypothetical protein